MARRWSVCLQLPRSWDRIHSHTLYVLLHRIMILCKIVYCVVYVIWYLSPNLYPDNTWSKKETGKKTPTYLVLIFWNHCKPDTFLTPDLSGLNRHTCTDNALNFMCNGRILADSANPRTTACSVSYAFSDIYMYVLINRAKTEFAVMLPNESEKVWMASITERRNSWNRLPTLKKSAWMILYFRIWNTACASERNCSKWGLMSAENSARPGVQSAEKMIFTSENHVFADFSEVHLIDLSLEDDE